LGRDSLKKEREGKKGKKNSFRKLGNVLEKEKKCSVVSLRGKKAGKISRGAFVFVGEKKISGGDETFNSKRKKILTTGFCYRRIGKGRTPNARSFRLQRK